MPLDVYVSVKSRIETAVGSTARWTAVKKSAPEKARV
jgi:hypothetical protein